MLAIFLVAGFSFQGTEGVGLAAAETADPQTNVPKAIRSVFWRILLFYIGAILIIGTLIPYTDPNLLRGDETHIAYSPFTMAFQRLPFGFYAANIMNAVILSSVLSCGNSSLYVASRMLHAMAHSRKAPQTVRQAECTRRARAGAFGTGTISIFAFLSKALRRQEDLSAAVQCLELERIHHLAGDRHMPSALS